MFLCLVMHICKLGINIIFDPLTYFQCFFCLDYMFKTLTYFQCPNHHSRGSLCKKMIWLNSLAYIFFTLCMISFKLSLFWPYYAWMLSLCYCAICIWFWCLCFKTYSISSMLMSCMNFHEPYLIIKLKV